MANAERTFGTRARSSALEREVLAGALAGLAGGVVFGVMMALMGVLPMIASLVGSQSATVGFLVHMVIAAGIGAGFGLVLGRSATAPAAFAGLGVVYGALWWVLGPLTVMPILLGMGPQWSVAAVAASLPSLAGHVIYGAVVGVVYALLASRA